jgi:membrane protein YdbS with pleckstrin-like domain
MNGHNRRRIRHWVALVGGVVLIAGHGIILYYVSSHTALSVAVVSGVLVLVVVKHLGLLGQLSALFRRGSKDPRRMRNP